MPVTDIREIGTVRSFAEFRRFVLADMERHVEYSRDFSENHFTLLRKVSLCLLPGIICCILVRLSQWAHFHDAYWLARRIFGLNRLIHKAVISPAALIGPGLYIPHTVGVIFHGYAGRNLTLYQHATVASGTVKFPLDQIFDDCPVLGDNVTVGVLSVVCGGVTIGSNTFIGAGTVAQRDVPANSILILPSPKVSRLKSSTSE